MTKSNTKQTFKIYWQHISRYKKSALLILITILLGSIGNLIAPLFYKQFFDILTNSSEIASKIQPLQTILIKILVVYLIAWIFWRFATYSASYFQSRVMVNLSNTCFAYLHKHSSAFFNNNFVGSLVKRTNRFSQSFVVLTDDFFWEVLPIMIDIVFIYWILASRSFVLGISILVWIIVYCAINYFFSLYKLKYDLRRSEIDSKVTGVLADTISNHLNVKLFNGYEREVNNFGEINSELQKLRQFTWNLGNLFEAVQALLMIFLEIGIFYYAIGLWQKGIITIGDFVLIQTYIFTIFHRLWNFGRIIRHYYEFMAEANEMTEILETPHEITDLKNAKKLKVTSGRIEFKEVSFSYHQTRRIVTNLNLEINPKEKVALVGASGSGKTTIAKLLLRNSDLEKGKIMIDGQDITRVTQESLWQNISFVNQEPILFHRSLRENIRYSQPEATDAEIIEAAKLAHCHEFISEFPEQYETFVGERGVKLSGGERQRVAIARAIIKNSPILVLDEATSSLDSESERLIQDALGILMKGKTVIVIAHRLSTIMKMDRIIVLQRGQIIEQGTHSQLIDMPAGIYRRFWEKQVGGFIK
jgi:ATP-binding cassette, subfamily B, bacterial